MTQFDVAIIGSGPAGLTAAATLARQLHTAIVFDSGVYRHTPTKHMHTVPGFDHQDPTEFRKTSRDQLLDRYSTIQFADTPVTTVVKKTDSCFEIQTKEEKIFTVKKVILAVGCNDILPEIEGYDKLWKKKIYHCLFCLGYEDRNAPSTGVLAIQASAMMPALALHAADNAAQLSHEVTIFTDGSEDVADQLRTMTARMPSPFKIETRKIAGLCENTEEEGERTSVDVYFTDETSTNVAFLVHNPLTFPQGPFVQQLGLEMTPTGNIKAEAPTYQTSCRGVFAAGDCVTPFKVVPHAIASGNFAAVAAATQLQAEKYGHFSMV